MKNTISILFLLVAIVSCNEPNADKKSIINTLTADGSIEKEKIKVEWTKIQGDSLLKNLSIESNNNKGIDVKRDRNKIKELKIIVAGLEYSISNYSVSFIGEDPFKVIKNLDSIGVKPNWYLAECPIYLLPPDSVKEYLAAAYNLGYKEFGFKCENRPLSRLLNSLNIVFKKDITQDTIDSFISKHKSIDTLEFRRNGRNHNELVFSLRIKPMTLDNLILLKNDLEIHDIVKYVQFVFKGCVEPPEDI